MSVPRSPVSGVVGAFIWLLGSSCWLFYWPRMVLELRERSKIHCLQVITSIDCSCYKLALLHFPYTCSLGSAESRRIWIASGLLNVFQKLVLVAGNLGAPLPIKPYFLVLMEYDTFPFHQVYLLLLCIYEVKWRVWFVLKVT
jgi:hypothetical protein